MVIYSTQFFNRNGSSGEKKWSWLDMFSLSVIWTIGKMSEWMNECMLCTDSPFENANKTDCTNVSTHTGLKFIVSYVTQLYSNLGLPRNENQTSFLVSDFTLPKVICFKHCHMHYHIDVHICTLFFWRKHSKCYALC